VQLNVRALFFVLISLFVFCDRPGETQAQGASSPAKPKWTVQLKNYGWKPPKSESNKKFFKDFTLAKLEAMDDNTRVLFISNDELVLYHTKKRDKITAPRLGRLKPSSLRPRTAACYKLNCGQFRCASREKTGVTRKPDLSLSVETGSSFLPMAPS
jgi:hypothetical protein